MGWGTSDGFQIDNIVINASLGEPSKDITSLYDIIINPPKTLTSRYYVGTVLQDSGDTSTAYKLANEVLPHHIVADFWLSFSGASQYDNWGLSDAAGANIPFNSGDVNYAVYFYWNKSSNSVGCGVNNHGTYYSDNKTVALVTDQTYKFTIRISESNIVTYWIDGVQIATVSTGVDPSVPLGMFVYDGFGTFHQTYASVKLIIDSSITSLYNILTTKSIESYYRIGTLYKSVTTTYDLVVYVDIVVDLNSSFNVKHPVSSDFVVVIGV